MSNIAESIKTAQDKDGMLRRALERIIQLYTDKSHFVYELLQNAEDAKAHNICFIQYSDRLEVLHDGKPFTSANLQGLCDIGKSDKINDLNQIGEFGVGFKSVFGICDTVKLYSAPEHYAHEMKETAIPFAVEIKDFTSPDDIESLPLEGNYTTKFVFPYTVGRSFSGFNSINELNATISKKLQNLGITTLLFMKNLETIQYNICLPNLEVEGEYLLEKKVVNDHCMLVSALGTNANQNKDDDSIEEISYLRFSRIVDKESGRTVDIAFPVIIDEDGSYQCRKVTSPFVSVYFPTETESKLNFIVQGPFRTTPNRGSIPAEDPDNIRLSKETAFLLRQTIMELKQNNQFNMSFVKSLPLFAVSFEANKLFLPLQEEVKRLFQAEAIIPTRNNGYVDALHARIARQEKLAVLFPDEKLTELINDRKQYHWLPTYLTETNTEYIPVFNFMTRELRIPMIRPEDLRYYFNENPHFLPRQNDDWLVDLYNVLYNVGNAFSKNKNESNMLTVNIVKTTTGDFVAPYRKVERQYVPNVFLPAGGRRYSGINIVDVTLYQRCQSFFDDILQLQKPNEYEYFVQDLKNRYSGEYTYNEDQHIEDIKNLLKFHSNVEYRDEINQIIKEYFLVKCKGNKFSNTFSKRIFLPETETGLMLEGYFQNINANYIFVDLDFYTMHGITSQDLLILGVHDSILTGESITTGIYETGMKGRQPTWWSIGEFRCKLSIENIKEALRYISTYYSSKDAIIKSKTIMRILQLNENRLQGEIRISTEQKKEYCELVRTLRGELVVSGWNGKWLYTESGDLVAAKSISKHELNTAIYGKLKSDSIIYNILGFKKTATDEVDDLAKTIPEDKLNALVDNELQKRYGITMADLAETYSPREETETAEEVLPFPTASVKNWETLKKHAAEMLIYADPVKYEDTVRRIRTSNHPREIKAYLRNMYRYEGRYQYACQMCHEACSNPEAHELFLNPETELDPINLFLCPNCGAEYNLMRNCPNFQESVKSQILEMRENDVSASDHVTIIFDGRELWFTQTHFAEIQELLKLSDEVKTAKDNKTPEVKTDDTAEKAGLSVYAGYVGKTIKRKTGFSHTGWSEGKIVKVDNDYLHIEYIDNQGNTQTTKVQLSFVLKNKGVYSIE